MKLKINDPTVLKIIKTINKINNNIFLDIDSSRTHKLNYLKKILTELYYDRLNCLMNIVHIIGGIIIYNQEIDVEWLTTHYQEKINKHVIGYNIRDLILPFVQIWSKLKTLPITENYINMFVLWDYMIKIWVFYNFSECLNEADVF